MGITVADAAVEPSVLYRDDALLVVSKPPGLTTTSLDGGDCLVARARALDPRAQRLHPSSRLDRDVSGVVVFARTAAATKMLLAARSAGRYQRHYVGLTAGRPEPPSGRWSTLLGVDPNEPRKRVVVREGDKRSHEARRAVT